MSTVTEIRNVFRKKWENLWNSVDQDMRPLMRSGRFGKRLQIRAHIGRPSPTEVKNIEKWKRHAKELQENYKGIRLWIENMGDRVGEYLQSYVVYDRMFSEKEDGYLNVVAVMNMPDQINPSILQAIGRSIPLVTFANRKEWAYILRRFKKIDYSRYMSMDTDLDLTKYTFDSVKHLLALNEEELAEGYRKLEDMNLKEPYVCFSNRDIAFLGAAYHNFRDSRIETRGLMIDYLRDQGIQAVRIGKKAEYRYAYHGSIDNVWDNYNPLMDIFLPLKAKFSVEDNSGINNIAFMTNPNVVITNNTYIMSHWQGIPLDINAIFLLKKMWSYHLNRFLTLREMIEVDLIEGCFDSYNYAKAGVEYISNTAEEIRDAAIEMNERLDGKWVEKEEDLYRQKVFDKVFDELKVQYHMKDDPFPHFRIGRNFLKQNWVLLGLDQEEG